MPEYTGIITTGGLYWPDTAQKDRWQAKYAGEWFRAKFSLLSRSIKDPKTREQLGYYWALLLPEITKTLIAEGHTITIEVMPGIKRQAKYTEDIVHEGLTLACGLVGEDGRGLRLSEMDKMQSTMFLDHVLEVAVGLKMNMENLEAARKGE